MLRIKLIAVEHVQEPDLLMDHAKSRLMEPSSLSLTNSRFRSSSALAGGLIVHNAVDCPGNTT